MGLLAAPGAGPFCLLAPLATRGPPSPYVAGISMTAVGVVISNVIVASFRQAYSPAGMLGRVSATTRFLVIGTGPPGALRRRPGHSDQPPRSTLGPLHNQQCSRSYSFCQLPVHPQPGPSGRASTR